MRRKTNAICIAAALAGLACTAGPATAATHRASCRVPHTHTIASGRRAVIREQAIDYGDVWYYGCVLSTRRPRKLFDGTFVSQFQEIAERAAVAGTYGALSIRHNDVDGGCWSRVMVFNLRSGRRLRSTSGDDPGDPMPTPPDCHRSVQRIVLTKTGGAAWATTAKGWPDVEIRKDDASGPGTLDRGAIDPGSLRLNGHTLSWVNAGVSKHAHLR